MILILDIDMTLADGSKRLKKAGKEPKKSNKRAYDKWLAKAQGPGMLMGDKPVKEMQELAELLEESNGSIHYVTSRSEKHLEETAAWLKEHYFPRAPIWMRKNDDYRPAAVYKEEVMEKITKLDGDANVVFIDDDPGITKLCRKHGWLHLMPFIPAAQGGAKR